MFGFAWVRTHLGVILSDALGVFKSFGLISEKNEEMIKKSRQDRGSFVTEKGPLAAAKSFTTAKQCFAAARPDGKNGSASGSPLQSYCSQHEKCCVLFCSAILLFQVLVYWTNEDPISV